MHAHRPAPSYNLSPTSPHGRRRISHFQQRIVINNTILVTLAGDLDKSPGHLRNLNAVSRATAYKSSLLGRVWGDDGAGSQDPSAKCFRAGVCNLA